MNQTTDRLDQRLDAISMALLTAEMNEAERTAILALLTALTTDLKAERLTRWP